MTCSARVRPLGVRLVVVLALLLVTAVAPVLTEPVAAAPVAATHGGPATLAVVSVEPGPGVVRVVVRVTYLNDGHGVADAAVTLAGESGEVELTPVTLAPSGVEGVYAGSIAVPTPGPWSLRATSADPTASQSIEVVVPAGVAPAGALPAGTLPTGATAPGAAPGAAPDVAPGAAPGTPAGSSADGMVAAPPDERFANSEDATSSWWWVAGVLAAVVAVGLGVVAIRQRSRPGSIE